MKNILFLVISAAVLTGCVGFIDVPSQNHSSRVIYLVIHHTSEDFAESLRLLTQPSDNPVSVHYLIPETGDDTYKRRSLKVHRLVAESRRAWHAGKSYWHGEESLNDRSIGIELVNKTYCDDITADIAEPTVENQVCYFLPYADEQIFLLVGLAEGILNRYPEIEPINVIGHADIAPDRRVDPGPLFPWKILYEAGVGAWYDNETVVKYRRHFKNARPPVKMLQHALNSYGYRIEETGKPDAQTGLVVRSFQMHFRPSGISGDIDAETVAILFALLEKYRPESLSELLENPAI